MDQVHGLVQERRNSIANALELRLSYCNPSKYTYKMHHLKGPGMTSFPNIDNYDISLYFIDRNCVGTRYKETINLMFPLLSVRSRKLIKVEWSLYILALAFSNPLL